MSSCSHRLIMMIFAFVPQLLGIFQSSVCCDHALHSLMCPFGGTNQQANILLQHTLWTRKKIPTIRPVQDVLSHHSFLHIFLPRSQTFLSWAVVLQGAWRSFNVIIWTLAALSLIFSALLLPDHVKRNVSIFFNPFNSDLSLIQA